MASKSDVEGKHAYEKTAAGRNVAGWGWRCRLRSEAEQRMPPAWACAAGGINKMWSGPARPGVRVAVRLGCGMICGLEWVGKAG